jgi:hypothetical protein
MLEGVSSRSLKKTSSTLKPARPVAASFMLDGDNKVLPSALDMPPPPPRLHKCSAKATDVSTNSNRQALDDSEGMAPPFARTAALGKSVDSSRGSFMEQARGRERSVSNAGVTGEGSDRMIQRMEEARGRERSVSNADVAGEGFQQWSAKVAPVSAKSKRQALDDSDIMAPPFARKAALRNSGDNSRELFIEQARGRERSVSNADHVAGDKTIHRTRSASLGAAPAAIALSGSCDTILEEEINEAASGTETIDFDFDIDLARENT